MAKLISGDQLPDLSPPCGASAPDPTTELARSLANSEAPGINTLIEGQTAMVWQEALGANVLDVAGRRYVDLTAGFGVAAAGHRHPAIVEAICRQATTLLHGLADVYAHPGRIQLAERLNRLVREQGVLQEPQVYFAVSGADAVEIALKTAQLSTGRTEILAFDPGYHGTTLGALEATSRESFRSPFQARFAGRTRRLDFGCELSLVEEHLKASATAAVIVEPIVGREGVLVPPDGWLSELAQLSRKHGAVVVFDEIFTGFGRTGDLFAHRHGEDPATGDLICCGKALGGGLPIGAVVGEADVLSAWDRGGEALHTGTFVGHPLACAAALAFLDLYEDLKLAELARESESRVDKQLRHCCAASEKVVEVRGRGLLFGLQLCDKTAAHRLSRGLLCRGVLALAGGADGTVVQFCPPLTISSRQLEYALSAVEQAVDDLDDDRRQDPR